MDSQLPGFYQLPIEKRRALLADRLRLSRDDVERLAGRRGLDERTADGMIENALGLFQLPLGACVNLRVDGADRIVPMAIEEPSVVAAASYAAKLLRTTGGVTTDATPALMIGQVQLLDVPHVQEATAAVLAARDALVARANDGHERLLAAGGGARDVEVRILPPAEQDDPVGTMLVVHLVVDVRDAMGANVVNAMCEAIAPDIQRLTGGRVRLRVLSNLTDRRLVTAVGRVAIEALRPRTGGDAAAVARGILEASVFAERDPYRAATHNKGIMNGVDAVLVAFGQDWRAVEAGAHAYAARDGRYTALARWRIVPGDDGEDALEGRLVLPLAVGTVGGAVRVHPTVQAALRLAQVAGAADLGRLAAAVGLAQNLGALRALADEGIQQGHMLLHRRKTAKPPAAAGPPAIAADASPSAVRDHFERARKRYLEDILALVQDVITASTPADSRLRGMAAYQMETGGKRLRAALPLLVAEALGAEPERMLPFAAACELLHNATLVHDDLQDGDILRRGRPTVWSRYGAASAIDLGDAMLYWTVLLLERLDASTEERADATRRLLRETIQIIDGQEREFALKDDEQPTLDGYFRMVEGKTSGLFVLPLSGAATLSGASAALADGLAEAGRHMGVLFQIQDDLLDLYGDKGRHGRGSDIAEGKRSVLVVHVLERSALGGAAAADAARLLAILDAPRDDTTAQDVATARAIFERGGAVDRAVAEIRRRAHAAAEVPSLAAHPSVAALVRGTCALFLDPLRDLLDGRVPTGETPDFAAGDAPQ